MIPFARESAVLLVVQAAERFIRFLDAKGQPLVPRRFEISISTAVPPHDPVWGLTAVLDVPATVLHDRSLPWGDIVVAPKWESSPGP